MSLALRTRLSLVDWLRYAPVSRLALSHVVEKSQYLRSNATVDQLSRSLDRLTLAARLGNNKRSLDGIEARLRKLLEQWSPDGFAWDKYVQSANLNIIHYSIILKEPRPNGEKGVLFVSFEGNWLRLLRYANITKLAQDYHLIISPTWSPPHDVPMLLAMKMWPGRFFTIVSALDDMPVFSRLSSKVTVMPLLASSWVNPDIFAPAGTPEKEYDIAMLANFAEYKRHFAMFRALRGMSRDVKLLILGTRWGGRAAENLMAEARAYGVENQVTIKERLPDAQMIQALQSSKVMVIATMTEGSCVAVVESLFADVPVGLLQGASVGSRSFINDQTGRFLRPGHLAKDLTAFIADYDRFSPREYMLNSGASYKESSALLNDTVRRAALESGEPWTVDCKPFHWRPHPEFLNAEDAADMAPEYERFAQAYGIPVHLRDWATVRAAKAS